MKHIRHEEFVVLFGTMMQKMDKLEYPKNALTILAQKMNKLWEVVCKNGINGPSEGFCPFLPIVPTTFFSIEEHLHLLDFSLPKNLPTRENQLLIDEPYFIIAVNDGSEFFESNLVFARSSIAEQNRVPLSDIESFSLFLHSNALTDPLRTAESYYAALGTKYVNLSESEIGSPKKEFIPTFDLQLRRFVLVEEGTNQHMLCPSRENIIV